MGFVYDRINDDILNEHFTSVFRPGYISIKGITMPLRFQDFFETLENWPVYNDDVWICSFPKTGTTWTQEMVWMIMNDLDFVGGEKSLGERFPFLDYSFLFDYRTVMENNTSFKPDVFLTESVKYVGDQKRPRFIKTHLPWTLLPKEIQNGTKQPKIIYVARNPKDTCVSYYHHSKLFEGYKGNFENFYKLFLNGKLCFAPYWENVLGFWNQNGAKNILLLKYEDLKKDLRGSIKKVAHFLDKPLGEEKIVKLAHHLSFDNMKNNKAVNYDALIESNKKFKLIEQEGCFMREGAVGGYKTEMSPEIIKQFDDWIQKYAPNNQLGY